MSQPPRDLAFLPHDSDAARPEDLRRVHTPPRPRPAVLGPQAQAWPGEDPNAGNFHYIGQALTPGEFKQYCIDYDFGSQPPSYWIWHHTYNPDASWSPVSSNQSTWWDRNETGMTVEQKKAKRKPQLDAIMRYYRDSLGWTVGPHLFTDDLFVWLFTPMYYIGIHANEGNSYSRSGQTRYSIGCEVIGAYDKVVWPAAVRAVAGWACACVKAQLGYQNVYTNAGQDRPDIHDLQLSGHRDYTTTKSCPGTAITSSFFVQVAQEGWAAYQANTPPGPQPSDPLKAKQLDGAPPARIPIYCSVEMESFYAEVGGLNRVGYAMHDEFYDQSKDCYILSCERAILKRSIVYGKELALLREAQAEGWMP